MIIHVKILNSKNRSYTEVPKSVKKFLKLAYFARMQKISINLNLRLKARFKYEQFKSRYELALTFSHSFLYSSNTTQLNKIMEYNIDI